MIGPYETMRDNMQYIDCWYLENNDCSPHFHSSIELTYVLSGQLIGSVNGEQYILSKDQFLLCPSYSLHFYRTKKSSKTIVLTVPMSMIPSCQKLFHTNSFRHITASLPAHNELLHCLQEIIASSTEDEILRKGYTYAIMGQLIAVLGLQPITNTTELDFARSILLYMQDSFGEPLTVSTAAEHFGYSRGHFSHIFSRVFGFSFCEYLNILRCRNAAMLLSNSDASLIETAMSSGYDNLRTFYRNFKHVYQMTPTEYINANARRKPI